MGNGQVDWEQAPKNARWWAVDGDGNAHWYCAPDIKAYTNFWGVDMLPAPTFRFVGDWRKSLTERPT